MAGADVNVAWKTGVGRYSKRRGHASLRLDDCAGQLRQPSPSREFIEPEALPFEGVRIMLGAEEES